MNITGKFVIFVKDKETSKGKIKTFSTTISRKEENGSYVNASMEVRFAKENFPYERLNKMESKYAYSYDVKEAWLDCRAFETKDGKQAREIFILIKTAKPLEKKEIVRKDARADLPVEDNLPF